MNIKQVLLSILDSILFNKRCLGCNKVSTILCKKCILSLPRPQNDLPKDIYALFEYRNPIIKKILTDAKYRSRFAGLYIFGPYLSDALLDIISEYIELSNYKRIILVPVPISARRFRKRGYNQSEIIAKTIMGSSKDFYILGNKIIKKIIDKTPQASIHNKLERLKSPKGTFKIVTRELLPESMCIIIDDVVTTGGTIQEMRRMLIASGAHTVIGLTIAH